jgi:hypothetical protein
MGCVRDAAREITYEIRRWGQFEAAAPIQEGAEYRECEDTHRKERQEEQMDLKKSRGARGRAADLIEAEL